MSRFLIVLSILMVCAGIASAQPATPAVDPCAEVTARAASAETKLKDWPALARYREANAKVAPRARDERRVVFMGDSITDNWNKPAFGGFFPARPYFDRGISGQTTPQMLVRFPADVIGLNPQVVVILAGTNDLAGNTGPTTLKAIEDNLAAMADLAKSKHIRVVLASVLPVNDYQSRDGKPIVRTAQRPPDQIRELNEWIKRFTRENKLTYLDYYSAMIDERGFLSSELSDEGLHPNKAGYAVMSPLAEAAIDAALKHQR